MGAADRAHTILRSIAHSGGNAREQRVEARGGLLHAMREIAVALVRLRELVAQRLVGRPQRARVREQRGEPVFERGEFVVHGARSIAPTMGARARGASAETRLSSWRVAASPVASAA